MKIPEPTQVTENLYGVFADLSSCSYQTNKIKANVDNVSSKDLMKLSSKFVSPQTVVNEIRGNSF